MSNEEIFTRLQNSGYFTVYPAGHDIFSPKVIKLVAKERKYAQITVKGAWADDGSFSTITILGKEFNYNLASDGNSGVYDENGKIVNREREYYDSNGKFIPASAYSYNARKFLKEILNIAFQDEGDAVYGAIKNAMTAPYTYKPGASYPSALGWADGHWYEFDTPSLQGSGSGYTFVIGRLNDTKSYEYSKAKPESTDKHALQYAVHGSASNFMNAEKAYELDKW